MSTELIEPEVQDFQASMPRFSPPAPVAQTSGWMAIIDKMIDKGAPMEQLDKLFELQQKYEREQARKAYVAALSAFKANAPQLKKNKRVGFDSKKPGASAVTYTHIELAEACRILIPALAEHGLSHGWETAQQDGGIIQVTCRLSHRDGHSETNTLRSVPDTSGAKNSIQAIGSTITYLERYTFLALVGMSAEEMDDDGQKSDASVIDEAQQKTLGDLLVKANIQGDRYVKFLDLAGVQDLVDLPAGKFSKACKWLEDQIAKQQKETAGL